MSRQAREGRALAALAAGLALVAAPARALPPVWTVHGPRGEIVLFGSAHLLPKGVDWRPAALTAALARADEIWFEMPLDAATSQDAARLAARLGALPAGDGLWSHLGAGVRARVERAAAAVGVAPETLTPLRPWMADLVLSLAADARAGADPADGVEARLAAEAPPGARRRAFETAQDQIGFLAGGDLAEQLASLDETAREIVDSPGLYRSTIAAWLAGDLASLRRDDLAPLKAAAPGAYRRLIVDRNRRWARTLLALSRRPGVTVVVVGVGHLIGRDGVPARLRRMGLSVDGP
jgi:uncharacterized protein YbaP (TraB family)